jgi:hypothetical protein
MSFVTPLAMLKTCALSPALAMSFIASISPSEAAAKPASMASTPMRSKLSAILSFFSGVKETPGVCSPSLRVVSKTLIFSGKLADKAIPHFLSLENPIIPHDSFLVPSKELKNSYKSFSEL